ncbi:MAG: hypothetical protein J6P61_09360 [Erysipelotrichaceae bacterium]|nr:hypothetical protein [Erysipelotrichaceae bacterium]
MEHSKLKTMIKGDDLLERWLYMEEEMEAIIRQEHVSGVMGNEISVISNYQTIFGFTTKDIEKDKTYSEDMKAYVREVEDVLHYFNMYKFHPDASVASRNGDKLTDIGLGIWSMVIMRLDDAYGILMASMED